MIQGQGDMIENTKFNKYKYSERIEEQDAHPKTYYQANGPFNRN